MKNKIRVIFDNAGGITLQLDNWAHYYGGYNGYIEQAANDYLTYSRSGNTNGWDGHEIEAAELDPSYDDIRNGGYKVMNADDIQVAIDDCEFGWCNIQNFVTVLRYLLSNITNSSSINGR